MKTTIAWLGILASMPCFAGDLVKIEQLGWIAGCWGFERDGKHYEEVWLPPAADGAMGMARTVKGGRTLNYEFTRLDVDKAGRISYVANPSGQTRHVFRWQHWKARTSYLKILRTTFLPASFTTSRRRIN